MFDCFKSDVAAGMTTKEKAFLLVREIIRVHTSEDILFDRIQIPGKQSAKNVRSYLIIITFLKRSYFTGCNSLLTKKIRLANTPTENVNQFVNATQLRCGCEAQPPLKSTLTTLTTH